MPWDRMVLDIETENRSGNPITNSTRIISVQIGDDKSQKLYYADCKNLDYTLDKVKQEIYSHISNGRIFTGYFINKFDVPLLRKFLDIQIPSNKHVDLITAVDSLPREIRDGFASRSLEDVCTSLGIKCEHKRKMKEKAKQEGISIGEAILNAYKEFVQKDGQKNTLFYEYAIGDVICEYQLLNTVTRLLDKR